MPSASGKILIVGLGSAGDVHPNVGLGAALRERGHRVVLLASTVFRPLGERAGLEFEGLGTDEQYHATLRDPEIWHPTRGFAAIARRGLLPAVRPTYEIIARHYRPKGMMVAAPGIAFGARIAQERLGVPLVTVHLQPVMLRSRIAPPCFGFPDLIGLLPRPLRGAYYRFADRIVIDPVLSGEINAFRAELGLAPVRRFLDAWWHSPQLVVGLFPEFYAPPQPDWIPNVHLSGFPLWDESEVRTLSPEVESFLSTGDPPLVFTAGSAMAHGHSFFEVSAEVCRTLGARGVFLTQFPEQLPARLPEGVRHFHYVPFSAILPRAAAFVHHGGIGTTAQALAAGVPQLVVPLAHDQPDNALRVKRLGVGDFLLPKRYTKEIAVERLKTLIASASVRRSCRELLPRMDPRAALEEACARIEGLLAQS